MTNSKDVEAAFAEASVEQSSDKMDDLRAMMAEARAMEEMIAGMEEDLARAKSQLHTLRTQRLPDLMAQIGVDELVFEDNHGRWKAKLSEFVSGGLPKDEAKRAAAIAWLDNHEGGALLTTEVAMNFARSDREAAKQIAETLALQGYAPNLKSSVHTATLQAWVRERLRNGEELDAEALGVMVGKIVKFTKRKK